MSDDGVKIYDLHDDDKRLLADLDRGKKVVKLITDQAFTGDRGMRLIQSLNERDKKFALFIDESHTWLISHYTQLQIVSGNTQTPSYKGTLFSRCLKLQHIIRICLDLLLHPTESKLMIFHHRG